jgi:tRNA threonylcarbamoyladenosine biosynthesis protein TsaE
MAERHLTKSAAETKKLGEKLAKTVLKMKVGKKAFVIALEGELGGGKTTFLQGFAKGLGIKEKILSPTFVILKKFPVQGVLPRRIRLGRRPASGWKYFCHFDCYRINKPKEILDLGFKEIISNPGNIVAIEWAERIKKILPRDTLIVGFKFINETKRKICIEGLTNF